MYIKKSIKFNEIFYTVSGSSSLLFQIIIWVIKIKSSVRNPNETLQ